jgi:hypothetical protein
LIETSKERYLPQYALSTFYLILMTSISDQGVMAVAVEVGQGDFVGGKEVDR